MLIVCAVSSAPFSFVENGLSGVEAPYFRDLLRIPKKEKWVDFCLQCRRRHYILLKTVLYLDLDVFHKIMNKLEAHISSIFRRFQRKEKDFNCLRSIDIPVFLVWKLQKRMLIVCAVSSAPFSFVENGLSGVEAPYFRDLLRIPKKEKWVDFCLQCRRRHYILLKTVLYLDLDVFHKIMNKLEAHISSIFRRFQRKEKDFNCLRSIDIPVFLVWKLKKRMLIVCAVSSAPFSFVENGLSGVEAPCFRDLLRIPKKENWVDFCLRCRRRHYIVLKTALYLDLDVFHNYAQAGSPYFIDLAKISKRGKGL